MTIFIILAVSGILSMIVGTHNRKKWGLPVVFIGTLAALGATMAPWLGDFDHLMNNMLLFDSISLSFTMAMLFLTLLILMASHFYYNIEVPHLTDIYALLMFSLSGAFLLVSANNLVMVFLGAEILSIPLYILAASHRLNLLSNEAGLKYYLMGSFATCFLLLGITLMYGAGGSFDLQEITAFIQNGGNASSLLLTGLTLVMGALLFKLSAVPFHFWAPDVYEGAPTILTAFVSTVVKISILGIFFRLIYAIWGPDSAGVEAQTMVLSFENSFWYWMLYLAAAASMIFGSVVALRQTDMKRLLAYTGIHNAGFMLIPLLYGRADQMGVVLYYLTFYGVAAILSLIVYAELKKHLGITSISGLQGLFYKEKAVAVALTLALLSFAGMPPLAGFWGKLGILSIGLQGGILPLMIVAIVTSVVGAYNYVRIMASMLSESTGEDYNLVDFPSEFKLFLYIVSAILVLSGLFPDVIIRMF